MAINRLILIGRFWTTLRHWFWGNAPIAPRQSPRPAAPMSSVNVAAGNLIVSLEDSGSRRGDFHTAVKGSRSRHIRKLQTARQSREFWAECEVQTLRSGPVSLRYLIGSEGETFATVCLKVVTLEGSQRLVRFHATACLADSHRKKVLWSKQNTLELASFCCTASLCLNVYAGLGPERQAWGVLEVCEFAGI
jgi:hypothetical protein